MCLKREKKKKKLKVLLCCLLGHRSEGKIGFSFHSSEFNHLTKYKLKYFEPILFLISSSEYKQPKNRV